MPTKEILIIDKVKITDLKKKAEIAKGKAMEDGDDKKYYMNSGTVIFCDYILHNAKIKKEQWLT